MWAKPPKYTHPSDIDEEDDYMDKIPARFAQLVRTPPKIEDPSWDWY